MARASIKEYVAQYRGTQAFRSRLVAILPILSLLLAILVFWWLKLTGMALAGEAFCGMDEHTHAEECTVQTLVCEENVETAHIHTDECSEITYSCSLSEHIHIASCYSDITADVETADDWEATLAGISPGLDTSQKIVTIAKSQLGYMESELNFEVGSDGVRRGYTRYGAWYGNPYGDWSCMFVSFCLSYAGVDSVPYNGGADAMYLEWQAEGLTKAPSAYVPASSDILFLDKDANGAADAAAIVTAFENGTVYVTEGDLEGKVSETSYLMTDSAVVAFGTAVPESNLVMMSTMSADSAAVIAKTCEYSSDMFTETACFVVYTSKGGVYYAFDGNGNAINISVDSSGNISADVEDPNTLLWSFTSAGTDTYVIENLSTGRYMHAYTNNGGGVTTAGAYSSVIVTATGGVNIQSNSEYAMLDSAGGVFTVTQNVNSAAVYNFGVVDRCTVWLDGSNGGLMALADSPNTSYTMEKGETIVLPEQWQSHSKYEYNLRGWYDVKNSRYYAPGAEITVTENLVFYADWRAVSYDVGQFNSQVTDTVSTNNFITTSVFDYSSMFNMMSHSADVTVTASGHTETWNMITDGTVPYKGMETIDFAFIDYDASGDLSYSNGRNSNNYNGDLYAGLYTDELGELLFSKENSFDPETQEGVIGKEYLGRADHLFKYMTDPSNENYGYYYYDSKLNAASYNQSDERFYVYDYLERTADSEKDGGAGGYSDFLPFNSPYVNTNGKNIVTYSYDGEYGEHTGVTHYMYDAKYNTYNNSVDNVGTNYWFGMSIEIDFYLPNDPGVLDEYGEYGNRDIHGNEMQFKFSGDDDVWVFIDGNLVLDIGGIHGIESGDINFSTGVININGTQAGTLEGVLEGDHILTMYYLERGSSQSNCAIYFNLAPRFDLTIQKEDVIAQNLLNGAEFSVFLDRECTVPAALWTSEAASDSGEASTNVFTVENGKATMWGFSAGKVYYLKETKPPDEEGYTTARGIIRMSLDNIGTATYRVEILDEEDENGNTVSKSNGFTVYGLRVDQENHKAYIVITNGKESILETTSIYTSKVWDDGADHTGSVITVYLTVTDPDGTVRRIREVTLGEANNWQYEWDNLPRYWDDGVTEIKYGIEEGFVEGYLGKIETLDEIETVVEEWRTVDGFEDGKTYLLKTSSGFLSTVSETGTTLQWLEDEEEAKTSSLALWTAAVSSSGIKFTNGAGQILSFNYSGSRYFYATTGSATYQTFGVSGTETGFLLYCARQNRSYYISGIGTNGRGSSTTSSSSALEFNPMTLVQTVTTEQVLDIAFRITNIVIETPTSLKVTKVWDIGMADSSVYEQAEVTVKLLADGKDTGRTVNLSLKNNWTAAFEGLPYTDADGNVLVYSVEEVGTDDDWSVSYSSVTASDSEPPAYEVTVTNKYKRGGGYEMPATGGYDMRILLCVGAGIMVLSLVFAYALRKKREKHQNR